MEDSCRNDLQHTSFKGYRQAHEVAMGLTLVQVGQEGDSVGPRASVVLEEEGDVAPGAPQGDAVAEGGSDLPLLIEAGVLAGSLPPPAPRP